MKLYHVVAMSKNKVIGKNNQLPWHFSSDMKHFRQLTTGHTVIMGRKTFESIGKALPNRANIVMSRALDPMDISSPEHEASENGVQSPKSGDSPPFSDDAQLCSNVEDALKAVKTEKAFIIGGSSIYEQTLDRVDGVYLTLIHQEYEGDAFYPGVSDSFREESREKLQDEPLIEVVYYERQPLKNWGQSPKYGDSPQFFRKA